MGVSPTNFAEVTGTRALDSYTQIVKQSSENPVPVVIDDEQPMPLGVFGEVEDEDPFWMLR